MAAPLLAGLARVGATAGRAASTGARAAARGTKKLAVRKAKSVAKDKIKSGAKKAKGKLSKKSNLLSSEGDQQQQKLQSRMVGGEPSATLAGTKDPVTINPAPSSKSQVEQLKINVTNIRSFLVKSNKQYTKQQADTRRNESVQRSKVKLGGEERRLEKKSSPLAKSASIVKRAMQPAGSLFDRIMEFAGTLLLGILVNALPAIVEKVKEVVDNLVNFFTPIQSGFRVIMSLFSDDINQDQLDVDKKRFDDGIQNIQGEGGLLDKIKEKMGPFGGAIDLLKAAIDKFRDILGLKKASTKMKLEKRDGKEGFVNTETGKFTERQFTSAERKQYESGSTGSSSGGGGSSSGGSSFGGSSTGQVSLNPNITPLQQKALGVLAKYESGPHGYEAVNQIGTKGGRGVLGFSGSFTNMTQHGGISLTSLTIGDIKKLQYDDGSMTNQQWISAGKLHAVGRYQFIGNTLPGVAKRAGIPDGAKFDSHVQDLMALQLMKERGISPWVGPSDKATAEERRIVEQARKQPISYNTTTSNTKAKITSAPNNKNNQARVINQPDPRKNRRGRTIAVQPVNTIQTQVVPTPVKVASASPQPASVSQLTSIWTFS